MGFLDLKDFGLSGRIGPIVTYVVDGQQRFRTYGKSEKPKSEKQKANQSKFGFVSNKISPLYQAIKSGFKDDKITFGGVCGKISREAVTGSSPDFTIDYSKIQIAKGRIELPENITLNFKEGQNIVDFNWDTKVSQSEKASGKDRVRIVCFNESFPGEVFAKDNVSRLKGKATVDLPKHWSHEETHYWFYILSWDFQDRSDSVYIK